MLVKDIIRHYDIITVAARIAVATDDYHYDAAVVANNAVDTAICIIRYVEELKEREND